MQWPWHCSRRTVKPIEVSRAANGCLLRSCSMDKRGLMKIKLWRTLVLAVVFLGLSISSVAFSDEYVRGHYRKDGTYVTPHYRSSPDGNPYNNFSFPGNTNPYTGTIAPGNPDTYLRRYNNSGGSNSFGNSYNSNSYQNRYRGYPR
jgi:hypothetical protein